MQIFTKAHIWMQLKLFPAQENTSVLIEDPEFINNFDPKEVNVSPATNAEFFLNRVVNFMLWFVGLIMLAVIIYAGYTMMTSSGNDEAVGKAKKVLVGAIAGFVVVLISYATIISILYASDFLAPRALNLIPQ